MQKAKILSTKVLKPHRYKNIHALGFCMLLHDLLSSRRLLQPRRNSPATRLPYPGAGSPETRIPFPKHTAHQKAIWKLICNMEGRELVFLPSFQITSLCLGILMAWGRGTACVLREQDSNASSSKRNEVIWGLQR